MENAQRARPTKKALGLERSFQHSKSFTSSGSKFFQVSFFDVVGLTIKTSP